MSQTKTNKSEYGFTRNHFALLGVAVLVFSLLVIPESGIKLSAMFTQAQTQQPVITYDQMRGEVYAQMGIGNESEYIQELENQFALLDRGHADGAVLGESIGIGAIPTAEQVFSRELLDQIQINIINDNSQNSIERYSENVLKVESTNGAIVMLANLNNNDLQVLSETKLQAESLVGDLKAIEVPSELADLHKYKLIYYQTLSVIANGFVGNSNEVDFANHSKILFSVMDKIEKTKNEISSKYRVSL
ncbi:MAG TPA: hypothetical protein PKD34_00105 [Candidatus Doudnabacteria bacterium]|nr:hypothetical protein [Candidatus Doudnabacteria bacterium]